jgi:hypothetical protein
MCAADGTCVVDVSVVIGVVVVDLDEGFLLSDVDDLVGVLLLVGQAADDLVCKKVDVVSLWMSST